MPTILPVDHLAQERPESGLLEVFVRRERIHKAVVLHHDKREAIGEAPGLISSVLIEVQGAMEQGGVHRYHPDIGGGVAALDKGRCLRPMRACEDIAHLGQHRLCDLDLACGAHALEERTGHAVMLVACVDERLDVGCVEEKPLAAQPPDPWRRFGVP